VEGKRNSEGANFKNPSMKKGEAMVGGRLGSREHDAEKEVYQYLACRIPRENLWVIGQGQDVLDFTKE